jgi:predicted GIY-YIG superfamily endonuclease
MKSFVATRSPSVFSLICPLMNLLVRLKDYRQFRSAVDHIPIYCVFGDTVMHSIAQAKPLSLQGLQGIRGLTTEKCELYGGDIISIVKAANEPNAPPSQPNTGESVVFLNHRGKGAKEGQGNAFLAWGGKRRGFRRKLLQQSFPLLTAGLRHASKAQKMKVPQRILTLNSVPEDDIYVLELTQGRVYVGRTSDMRRRLSQHMSGQGSAFTQAFPPTGTLLPRLGRVTGSAEAAERDETLRYMFLRGVQLVRGWKYTKVHMAEDEQQDAEENIRELFDLCRRCGHPGHFMTQCRAAFDRLGRPCVR